MQGAAQRRNSIRKQHGQTGKQHPKSLFTTTEDMKLVSIVNMVGENNWTTVSQMMGNRNPRQCMERWIKYLSPNINRSPFSEEEDELLLRKYSELGGKWMKISRFFDNRTDIALKNRWSLLQRRIKRENSSSCDSPSSPSIDDLKEIKEIKKEEKIEEKPMVENNFLDSFNFDFDFCDIGFETEMSFW